MVLKESDVGGLVYIREFNEKTVENVFSFNPVYQYLVPINSVHEYINVHLSIADREVENHGNPGNDGTFRGKSEFAWIMSDEANAPDKFYGFRSSCFGLSFKGSERGYCRIDTIYDNWGTLLNYSDAHAQVELFKDGIIRDLFAIEHVYTNHSTADTSYLDDKNNELAREYKEWADEKEAILSAKCDEVYELMMTFDIPFELLKLPGEIIPVIEKG